MAARNKAWALKRRLPLGTRFSTMIVTGYSRAKNGRTEYKVLCDCGRRKIIQKSSLKASRSCGCLQNEQISVARTIHGETKSKNWITWDSMVQRCTNPNHKSWKDYGGRGIKVCDEWLDYLNFRKDMGLKPDGVQIDRKDNDGHYCKENCRWATATENQNNRRTTRYLEHDGKKLSVSQWARMIGLGKDTLARRIESGWEVARALTTPVRPMTNGRRILPAEFGE